MGSKRSSSASNNTISWKTRFRKIWYFIWDDDSWASWFVNIVLAFVLIKFIIYPVIGFFMMTSHPIVAVISGSMEHDGGFEEWWQSPASCENISCSQAQYYSSIGIERNVFSKFNFHNGFNKGDIMIVFGTRPDKVEIGDVIIFRAHKQEPIIHRVISISRDNQGYVFKTKGDHNTASYYFEAYIPEESYIGRAIIRLPYLGYLKLGFMELLSWFS